MIALDVRDLTVTVSATGVRLLDGVALRIPQGSIHGLVGESGAGKSTLAKAILGVLPPGLAATNGAMSIAGQAAMARPAGTVAFIPQDPLSALNPSRRIREQMADAMRASEAGRAMARSEIAERARQLLSDVQIAETERVLNAYPHQLSGGMRQRILIASAFASNPALILADEPTTALDVTVQRRILKLLRAMQRRHGTAMVFVTHDLGVVAQICDAITVLYAGRVVEQGSVPSVFAEPAHPYTRALIAASPRIDRPEDGLRPIDREVFDALRAEGAS